MVNNVQYCYQLHNWLEELPNCFHCCLNFLFTCCVCCFSSSCPWACTYQDSTMVIAGFLIFGISFYLESFFAFLVTCCRYFVVSCLELHPELCPNISDSFNAALLKFSASNLILQQPLVCSWYMSLFSGFSPFRQLPLRSYLMLLFPF